MSAKSSLWKKIGIGAGIVIVLLVVAKKAGWLGSSDVTKVSTEKVIRRNITEIVSANGKVQPEVELKINSDVSGEIVDLYVKEGDVVKKGTLLCRINPEIYKSSMDRAAASVNGARASLESSKSRLVQSEAQFAKDDQNYIRNKKLFDEGVISKSDFEAIKAVWEVSKAEVAAARQSVAGADFNVRSMEASMREADQNLNKTNIYAPVDGTISKLDKEKGERVVGTNMMEGTEIMRLANLNEMEVSVDVSENDIVKVNRKDTADIEIDAYVGRKFLGIVTEVANSSSTASSTTGTDQVTNFTVKVRILRESYADLCEGQPASFSPFRPGMSASVDIRTKKVENVLSLPIAAVTTRDTSNSPMGSAIAKTATAPTQAGGATTTSSVANNLPTECVFLVVDGKAKRAIVKSGIQDNQYIEIKSGLKENEEVITGPYSAVSKSLKEDAAVKVVPKEELFDTEKK